MMLKDVPKKNVILADRLDSAAKFDGVKLVDNNPPLSLGCEHINTKRTVYDLSSVLPETTMTEVQWTKFPKALIYIMPEDSREDMW
eukprot:1930609-Karenia_brevis.AAC.2